MADFDEQLICAVKEYPCLFNTKSSDFKINWKKENAWTAIAKQLNSNVEVTSKRWKALRERYTKEHKKVKPTGSGTDEMSKEWQFYQLMDFLKDFVRHRNTVGNFIATLTDSNGDDKTDDMCTSNASVRTNHLSPRSASEPPIIRDNDVLIGRNKAEVESAIKGTIEIDKSKQQTSKCNPRKRKREIDPFEEEILQQLKESNKSTNLPPDDDEDLSFGRIVGMNLKRLKGPQKSQAKIRIHQLLYEIEFVPYNYQDSPYSAGNNSPYYNAVTYPTTNDNNE